MKRRVFCLELSELKNICTYKLCASALEEKTALTADSKGKGKKSPYKSGCKNIRVTHILFVGVGSSIEKQLDAGDEAHLASVDQGCAVRNL